MDQTNIDRIFTYHSPTEQQASRYKIIRTEARLFASMILVYCPDSPERTIAIRKLQETVMFANAAIAINEPDSTEV